MHDSRVRLHKPYVEKGRHSRTSRIEFTIFDGSNNHNRISVFTRSSAENEILFTNVNVEIHKDNVVVDSESVDAPKSPENFRYACSSRLGVTCHPSAAAKQRFLKTLRRLHVPPRA